MPQRFMLSLHIHRHLFPVEVTPQLPLQVIEVYASISCWEPSTDMKSLLHFPQDVRWSTARPFRKSRLREANELIQMNELVRAHAHSCPTVPAYN